MKILLENKVYLQEYDILILGSIPAYFLPKFVLEEVEQRILFCRERSICSFVIEISNPDMVNWVMDADFIPDYDTVLKKSPKEIQRTLERFCKKWRILRYKIEQVGEIKEEDMNQEIESLFKDYIACCYMAASLGYHLDSLEGRYITLLPPKYEERASLRA